jgi:Rrf2 family protein
MRLTTFSDYTLRTLIYLALRPGALCTIDEIAEAYGISANHLTKVVHQAAQAGEVQTVRGQRGGLRLAGAPTNITIGAVLRRLLHPAGVRPAAHASGSLGGIACGTGSRDDRRSRLIKARAIWPARARTGNLCADVT